MRKKLICFFCAVMIINVLCCCAPSETQSSGQSSGSGQTESQSSSSGRSEEIVTYDDGVNLLYTVPTGDTTKVVDENGVLILEEYNQVTIVSDLLSGQQKYICVTKNHKLSDSNEAGAAAQYEHKLYDINGKLVYDWKNGNLSAAWDDRVMIYDYTGGQYERASEKGVTTMLDIKTGETLFSAEGIMEMGKRHFILIQYELYTDTANGGRQYNVPSQIDVYDLDAQHSFSREDAHNTYTSSICVIDEKEYFTVSQNDKRKLLDENGNVIIDDTDNYIYYRGENLVSCGNRLIELPSGETIYTANGEIEQYFGDRFIIMDSSNQWYLTDADGKTLMRGNDYISYSYDNNSKPKYFYSGGSIYDYDGNLLFYAEGKTRYNCVSADLDLFSTNNQGDCSLIDMNQNVLYETKDCDGIYMLQYYIGGLTGGTEFIGAGRYDDESGLYMLTLLDMKGNVIFENCMLRGSGPDRLVVKTNFRSGLVDPNGNWVVWWPNVETLDAQS